MDDCPFCKIASGRIPVKKLAEDEHGLAFPDLNPQAPLHALVIPKAHVSALTDVTDWSLLGHLLALGHRVAREHGVAESGYRTVINAGRDAGQTVFHLHLHVLGGRVLTWPPG